MNKGSDLKQRPAGDLEERREGIGRRMDGVKAYMTWRKSEKPTARDAPGLWERARAEPADQREQGQVL